MSDITFEISESEYDQKLLVKFDYDEDIVEKIKQLPWEDVHYGYHKPDDKESELYGYVDEECWFLDYNNDAIEIFENVVGITIPTDLPSEDSNQDAITGTDSVTLTAERNTQFRVEPQTEDIINCLESALSTSDQVLFDKGSGTAPLGLLDRAENTLADEGYNVTTTWKNKETETLLGSKWRFEGEFKEYQRQAAATTIENTGGIITLPEGEERIVTALRILFEIDQQALIITHDSGALERWREHIETTIEISPGVISENSCFERKITVATLSQLVDQRKDILNNTYNAVIFDKCHKMEENQLIQKIGNEVDPYYRIGISTNPWDELPSEKLTIEGVIRGVSYEADRVKMDENSEKTTAAKNRTPGEIGTGSPKPDKPTSNEPRQSQKQHTLSRFNES